MHKIARRLSAARTDRDPDTGFSIVEVLVATLIFMLLSVGIAQATVTSIRMAGDQKHRVTALSLAAGEIDAVRAIGDPFKVTSNPQPPPVTIDGTTYTINLATEWVSGTGTDIPCGGAGTANLQVKRVNVSVTWTGEMAGRSPVTSDTVLAPVGRINDPTQGTLIIAATRADGTGSAGVTPTVTPLSGGAAALATAPPATDSDGCSYALRVKPGVYRVGLSKTNYVDNTQNSSPTLDVTVVAGSTVTAPFAYDLAAGFTMSYAPGAPAGTKFASNAATSYVNTYGTSYTGVPATASLYPWPAGYIPLAGHYVAPTQNSDGCRSVDPSEWQAGNLGSGPDLADGDHGAAIAAGPGTSGTAMEVRMGLLKVKSTKSGTLTATSATAPASWLDPGCAIPMSYTFSVSANVDTTIALPFGTWAMSEPSASLTLTPLSNVVSGLVSGNTVMLDPRPAA
jgi:Tfp pilus assembly protein PilX